MNFSLEQLLAFVAVYEELSFSKAAVKLNKHRTTIGQVITNLEDLLAVSLFNRVGRSVEPTEDARLLYHYAKQTIEQARTFDKVALSLAHGGLESVSIAYSSAIPHRLLVLLRVQLAADFPMMRVNFFVRNRNEIKEGLATGKYQFGIVNVHDSRAIHSLDSTFLGHFEFVPFVQKGGELASMAPDRVLTALRNSKQFVLRSFIEEGMGEKVIVSSNHEEVDQLALVVKMVEAGLGWAVLPRTLAHSEFSNNDIEPVEVCELLEGVKFGFGLWCQPSKQIGDVKDSIMRVVTAYREKLIRDFKATP
ncbi:MULTISPECIES: LysR family transcriptional regulator [Vibrio]|uniref:LysR family transcriptional regulator n=2 Tax=Vibrio TaxID=662 RepID=A0ABM6S7H7_9VIBR|nr:MULTISPECIES: LysR family transcriptional regulator [Vibrio]AVH25945.1 LysR family transcriptional regulator [Vibrio diabolicus]MDU9595127.1 LysR family transcriptional regulator [Vibrio sp. 2-1-2a]MDU9604474.1 LysR family transcriptional regulator [Vibrio sp. 1-2-3a]NKJ70310.1 LysR family transcriptional regulator [Vibrio chemaguriensis]HDU8576071.1 LysR family transcriptional regulator [Vibrio diabolicus]